MECRRRLGKRRLTNLSEVGHPSTLDFGAFLGLGRTVGSDQWHWEAPSKQHLSGKEEESTQLPAWLSEYEPMPLDDMQQSSTTNVSLSFVSENNRNSFEDDLRIFLHSLQSKSYQSSATAEIQDLCAAFNHTFKQNLTLGLIPVNTLSASLRSVTKDIRKAISDKTIAASLCLSFYAACWEGIEACKVLRRNDFTINFLNGFLFTLSRLPTTREAQDLIATILNWASPDHIVRMEKGIFFVMKSWVSNWTKLKAAEGLEEIEGLRVDQIGSSISRSPAQSVAALVKALDPLPPQLARNILLQCTHHMIPASIAEFKGPMRVLRQLRSTWLSVVANTRCVDEELLLKIWSALDFNQDNTKDCQAYTPSIPRLTMHEGCEVLLEFWTRQGLIKAPERVVAAFRASSGIHRRPNDAIPRLLQALLVNQELCEVKRKAVFRILQRIDKPQAIHLALQGLRGSSVRIPSAEVTAQIRKMSLINPRYALNMFNLFHTIRLDNTPVLLDNCGKLASAMISSPEFHPDEIWGAMGIPLYQPQKLTLSRKTLPRERVAFIHKMAVSFAQAHSRSHRVALRNVMQCIMYLRRYGSPVSAELTRALCFVGLSRDILRQHWPGCEKISWILELVSQIEGSEIASKIDGAMYHWRVQQLEERQRLRREANPLRVRGID
jgi:hypothetical protein